MRFATSIATAVLALATTAFAQTADFDPIFAPEANEVVPAGAAYTITWEAPANYPGTISISLIGGKTQNTQVPLQDIASGVDNAAKSYTWTVDAALGTENVYGLVFKLESDPTIFQYSNPFQIKKGSSGGASSDYPAPTGSATTTVTNTGIKTITLSSTAYSTPASTITYSTASSNATSSHPAYTHTGVSNHTTTAKSTVKPTYTLITSTEVVQPTVTQPSTVPTGTSAATRAGVGSMTVVGLLMAALFM